MMAYGTWDDVINEYHTIYLKSRFKEHTKGILRLIPDLQTRLEDYEIVPGTSHGTLFLTLGNIESRVLIWYEGNDEYIIYSEQPDTDSENYVTVTFDNAITIIRRYLDEISGIG